MKTLANCKPTEFLKQTVRIKRAAENWLKLTDILSIRKRVPEVLPDISDDMSDEEKEAVQKKRKEIVREKALENMSAIFDACFDEHPAETLEVIALCCFMEPDDIDNHETKELLEAALEMAEDETVIRFFTLLMRLGN